MFNYFYKRRLIISVLFTVASFFSIIIAQTGKERINSGVGSFIRTFTNPIFYTFEGISESISEVWYGYIALIGTHDENLVLKKEISDLKERNFSYQEMEIQYHLVLKDLEFHKSNDFPKVYAEIILNIQRDYSRMMIINRGSNDGIAKNDGVLTPDGAVGRVIGNDKEHASIMLINDSRSQYPAIVQRTRDRVMISGTPEGMLKIYFVPREIDLREGDVIITSSHAGIFPKGIKIGTISNIKKQNFGLFQEGIVEPAVNLSRLERVFVIKSSNKQSSDYYLKMSELN